MATSRQNVREFDSQRVFTPYDGSASNMAVTMSTSGSTSRSSLKVEVFDFADSSTRCSWFRRAPTLAGCDEASLVVLCEISALGPSLIAGGSGCCMVEESLVAQVLGQSAIGTSSSSKSNSLDALSTLLMEMAFSSFPAGRSSHTPAGVDCGTSASGMSIESFRSPRAMASWPCASSVVSGRDLAWIARARVLRRSCSHELGREEDTQDSQLWACNHAGPDKRCGTAEAPGVAAEGAPPHPIAPTTIRKPAIRREAPPTK
eukprot:scaffold196_cov371-Prasinococcus_capsulatus_cf.AAC.19